MKRREIKWLFILVISICIMIPSIMIHMKKKISTDQEKKSISVSSSTMDKEPELYAQSAVLMDADSGRILFGKNEDEIRPMASTTKILTCIIALENMKKDQCIGVSKEAAKQPKVHLGVREKEKYYVKDLLYSLMLESHNDSAVMIAEAIGGDVQEFAKMMNQKAEEIGCKDTYFITPNGLDAEDEYGKHSTTAYELAKIMRYCMTESPKKDEFLTITGTKSYHFSDLEKKRQFDCNNHNAFLEMMDGALSGKTGFTGKAGYCYVGALEKDGRMFVVSLLGCGWPNHRGYKWIDTKKLMEYGIQNYDYKEVWKEPELLPIPVKNGVDTNFFFTKTKTVDVQMKEMKHSKKLLLCPKDRVETKLEMKRMVEAPIQKGVYVGYYRYYLNGKEIDAYPIVTCDEVLERSFQICLDQIISIYFFQAG